MESEWVCPRCECPERLVKASALSHVSLSPAQRLIIKRILAEATALGLADSAAALIKEEPHE